MMTIKVVEECPQTKVARGIMHISHKVLSTIAGAVYDKNEWMAFLVGTRTPDGLQIMVTDLFVPLQTRGHGSCETVKEEPLAPDVVGVIHSHHSMGAFFSQTDVTKLNPRFPTSIVVAQTKYNTGSEAQLLGFQYKAEGRVPLPCGTPGIVEFTAQPYPMVKDWPIVENATLGTPKPGSLTYCPHTHVERTHLTQIVRAKCGLSSEDAVRAYFGRLSTDFIAAVEKNTTAIVNEFPGGYRYEDKRHHGKGKKHPFQDGPWNDDDFLRSWSAYGGD
jgi:proteasome lid subunit RPN8/RPN11